MLGDPLGSWLQAAQAKKQNQQQMFQNIGGIGEGLGGGFGAIGDAIKQHRMKQGIAKMYPNNPMMAQLASAYPEQFIPAMIKEQDPMTKLREARLMQLLQGGGAGKPGQFATPDQAIAYMGNTPQNQAFVKSMGGQIPWSEVKGKAGLTQQENVTKLRQGWEQAYAERVDLAMKRQYFDTINTLDKGSGGIIGMAGVVNMRANQGMELLNDPNITQDARVYNLLQSDLAAIAQGGSPSLAAQAEAALPNFKQKANALLQTITADPKTLNTPAVKLQLNAVFSGMKRFTGGILDQNTRGFMDMYGKDPWVKAHPKEIRQLMIDVGMGVQPIDPTKLPPMPQEPQMMSSGNQQADPSGVSTEDLLLQLGSQ